MRLFIVAAIMERIWDGARHIELKRFIGACPNEAAAIGEATLSFMKDHPQHSIQTIVANDVTDTARDILRRVDAVSS